jgi:diketogulonate reductase-like aldo/keto reductase
VSTIANKHSTSSANMIFSFLQNIGVTLLTGSSNEQHIQNNTSINLELDISEIESIASVMSFSEQVISLYSRLKSGELMTANAIKRWSEIRNKIQYNQS